MIEYTILGCSPAMLSMMLESVHRLHLGSGVDVGPRAVVGPHTRIGNFVSLNRASTIGLEDNLSMRARDS